MATPLAARAPPDVTTLPAVGRESNERRGYPRRSSSDVLERGRVSGRGRSLGAVVAHELEQRRVDFLRVRPPDVVRAAGDLDDGQVVDQSLVPQSPGRGRERQGAVSGAVQRE